MTEQTMYTIDLEWDGTFSVVRRHKAGKHFTTIQIYATYSTRNRAERLKALLEELDREERGDWRDERT